MILVVKPCRVSSLKRSFLGKIEEASTRAGLEMYAPTNLLVGNTWLVLQEKLVFEEREVRRNPEENFAKMDESGDLKNVGLRRTSKNW
jgi:hypothetical protein